MKEYSFDKDGNSIPSDIKKVSFKFIPSGDYECATFAVDKETFLGFKAAIYDPKYDDLDRNKFIPDRYDLYISDLYESLGMNDGSMIKDGELPPEFEIEIRIRKVK